MTTIDRDEEFYNGLLDLTRDFILRNRTSPNTVNVSVETFCRITGTNTTRYQPAYLSKDGKDRYAGMLLKVSDERDTFVSLT